jgi:hypothetical protein
VPMIFKDHNPDDEPMDLVATHQRLLLASCLRTQGPILELGCGWYSTPLLHEIARAQQRKVYTVDNNWDWLAEYQKFDTEYHEIILIGWWGELLKKVKEGYFGVVFCDQGQPAEREYAIRELVSKADVFVLHDTEEGFAYGYDRLLGYSRYNDQKDFDKMRKKGVSPYGMFRYQWTDHCQKAWTTVASNTVDVTKWGLIELPPVRPSQDIT